MRALSVTTGAPSPAGAVTATATSSRERPEQVRGGVDPRLVGEHLADGVDRAARPEPLEQAHEPRPAAHPEVGGRVLRDALEQDRVERGVPRRAAASRTWARSVSASAVTAAPADTSPGRSSSAPSAPSGPPRGASTSRTPAADA